MSEENTNEPEFDERTLLKQRADLLGISYSNNIKTETLRAKITEKLEGVSEKTNEDSEDEEANALELGSEISEAKESIPVINDKPEKKLSERDRIFRDKMKLVRVRIQNLNPRKKELPGEVFTVANDVLGVVKKYVPYGELTDDGYHIPYCIYDQLRKRKFVNIRVVRDKRTKVETVKTTYVNEFAIEVLPPLTKEELNNLATAQIAAGSID